MTIATDSFAFAAGDRIPQQPLSFNEFLARYGGENRYELIDGEVFDLEPTGFHEEVAAFLTTKLCVQIDYSGLPWFILHAGQAPEVTSGETLVALQRGLFRPNYVGMTAFRPDVAVIDRSELPQEPLWLEQSILTLGSSIKFVAEVVSSNWQNDYARKVEDYAALGVLEYWIVDYAGLGGTKHIGKPKQPTLSICTLVDGEYEIQPLRGDQMIVSQTFPGLKLTAAQVLQRGG
jgi:Uma2 family endonuclease